MRITQYNKQHSEYYPEEWRTTMTENDEKLLESLKTIIPHLTPLQKEKLLSFGEGMAVANREMDSCRDTRNYGGAAQNKSD